MGLRKILIFFTLFFFICIHGYAFAGGSQGDYDQRMEQIDQKMEVINQQMKEIKQMQKELKEEKQRIKEIEAKQEKKMKKLEAKESRIEKLEVKTEKNEDLLSKASEYFESSELLSRLNPAVRFDGWVYGTDSEGYEAEFYEGRQDPHGDTWDARIENVEVYLYPEINDWIHGMVEFEYGSHRPTLDGQPDETLYVEEANMKFGNTDKFPLYCAMGKYEELPYGYTPSFSPNLPLTIFMQRIRHNDFRVGFEKYGINVETAVWNGDVDDMDSKHEKLNRVAAQIEYHHMKNPIFDIPNFDFHFKVSYMNNIQDTLVRTLFKDFPGNADVDDGFVGGIDVASFGRWGKWRWRNQITTALDDLDEDQFRYQGDEAQPTIWQFEIGRFFDLGDGFTVDSIDPDFNFDFHETFIFASYQGSDELCNSLNGKFYPQRRYTVGFHVSLTDSSYWGIEYEQNDSYGTGAGVDPDEASKSNRKIRACFSYWWGNRPMPNYY